MDFKAALQAEIEAKKRQLNKLSSSSNDLEENGNVGKVKSVKVADMERQKQEEYLEKQRALDEQRQVSYKMDNELLNIIMHLFS